MNDGGGFFLLTDQYSVRFFLFVFTNDSAFNRQIILKKLFQSPHVATLTKAQFDFA